MFAATIGWWGFVYPELSAVTEEYVLESAKEETNGESPASFVEMLVNGLGDTGIKSGNVRIKSRIMEYLYQGKEKGTGSSRQSRIKQQGCNTVLFV